MKTLKFIGTLFLFLLIVSCNSIKVSTDYDTKVDFSKYQTFAFYKKGIDKASISDLDKKRIMRAIEQELQAKGMKKSSTPDVLVSLFTKSRERIDINDNRFGGFWYPWYYGQNQMTVSRSTEGTLFIDILDAKENSLVWQGIGIGTLRIQNVKDKQARIKEFVKEIMLRYPPGQVNR